ncbi:glucose-6-phosphate dehydrogenase [Thermodesulfobacteriota bacterium]
MESDNINGHFVLARADSSGIETDAQSCFVERSQDPCMVVLVGASGDLTGRKIIPALYDLYRNNALPENFCIVGCARTEMDDDEFRQRMRERQEKANGNEKEKWKDFSRFLNYRKIDYSNQSTFKALAESLKELDSEYGTKGNRIFYFAIPPSLYETVATMLGESGLAKEGGSVNGWSRIVVEKPFGRDLETAVNLDGILHEYFKEHQIFRIDHYLAKETVQNILMFRFANSIFEPIWNRGFIDFVHITAAETLGVEHRAGYYEQAGVLRDMFQNHMMQLLALTAMEPPSLFEANRVRDEKVKVYRALRPFPVEKLRDFLILGQYGQGIIEGEKVPAYRDEPGVDNGSVVPTYAAMKIFIDNWRWQGVPFYLVSGKRLKKKLTEIVIQFKEVPHSMFRPTIGEHISANRLILGIYPDEKISLTFQTKSPSSKICLRNVTMDFNYHYNFQEPTQDAYETVLLDCMIGDQMLFWRQDGVELCWSFLTPILKECEMCGGSGELLKFYKSGGWGPKGFEVVN